MFSILNLRNLFVGGLAMAALCLMLVVSVACSEDDEEKAPEAAAETTEAADYDYTNLLGNWSTGTGDNGVTYVIAANTVTYNYHGRGANPGPPSPPVTYTFSKEEYIVGSNHGILYGVLTKSDGTASGYGALFFLGLKKGVSLKIHKYGGTIWSLQGDVNYTTYTKEEVKAYEMPEDTGGQRNPFRLYPYVPASQ